MVELDYREKKTNQDFIGMVELSDLYHYDNYLTYYLGSNYNDLIIKDSILVISINI